jgi:ribosomal protein L24E
MAIVKCDYCGKEIERHIFCKKSHKVMYHWKRKRKIQKFINNALDNNRQV